jgi:NADPH:quinone reductase-like Zn-dependent oxidoreductase
LIVDSICDKSTAARRRALHRDGTLVIVGSTNSGLWLGPVVDLFVPVVVSTFVHQRLVAFIAKLNQADLSLLADLASKDKIRSVIDRTYSLADVPSALSYLEEGHARGKVVITVP